MNKNGFTLTELLITIGIVALLTILVLPAITRTNDNNNAKKFSSYEKVTAEYAEAQGRKGTFSICEINGIEDVKKLCIGYVKETNGNYKAYLNCEQAGYKTEGYEATLFGNNKCN